ncbi:MAG: response regulator, partial [Zetaproteobacteria bacterium]|nr:response regulator [Zetaproteobacteria bacterium]
MNYLDKKTLHILLLEDDIEDAKLIERNLTHEMMHVIRCETVKKARQLAHTHHFDIILTDLHVSDSNGLATLHKLLKHTKDIPIMVLSGMAKDDLAIQAVREGAQDFIRKDNISRGNLALKINFAIERNCLLTELRAAKEEAKRQSQFKSDFLAHFSHEIRTPLNAVIGMSSLLERTKLNEDQQDLLSNLKKGGDRLLSII